MAIGAFKPIIWTAKLIATLNNEHLYAQCCNRNYEGEIKSGGDSVRIGTVGPINIGTYTPNSTTLTRQKLFGADQTLVIDQVKYFDFDVDDVDKQQAAGNFMAEAMTNSAQGLAETQDDFLAALIYAGVPSANTRAAATVGTGATDSDMYEVLVDLRTILNKNSVPKNSRWCVIGPDHEGLLLKDPRFVSFGTPSNRAALLGDPIGRAAGFTIYVSNNAPTSMTVVLAGDKGATTLAEQINKVEAFRPEGSFADAVKGLHLYGAKVTQPSRLACCVATPA